MSAAAPQKVKNDATEVRRKQAVRAAPKLDRTTFRTSREMDFFSEKELVTQTGHDKTEWPFVIVKELIDNALDACEESDIPPNITIAADANGITIADNGPGLPESTLRSALDFTVRASNREAYVAPDRGAQGNALKTILPMPRVLDAEHGRLIVEAHGKRHVITCGADPISQRAEVHDDTTNKPTIGTTLRVEWSTARVIDDIENPPWPFYKIRQLYQLSRSSSVAERFRRVVESFAAFNPHATFRLEWFGRTMDWQATNVGWEKWKPNKPTSPHWYEPQHLARLIGAYITHDREHGCDRLVSDFVAEFDGLTGSRKRTAVLTAADLKRERLSIFDVGGDLDHKRIASLLTAMKANTRSVLAKRLGVIGEEHFRNRLLAMGVQPDSFRYSKMLGSPKSKKTPPDAGGKSSFIPWVVESAFGWLGDQATDNRVILPGVNWSGAIGNPFRSFGATGEGLEAALSEMRAGRHEPIVFVLHLAHPRIEYRDRGKSALVIGGAG